VTLWMGIGAGLVLGLAEVKVSRRLALVAFAVAYVGLLVVGRP
jgi:hypothetical protein